MSEPLPEGAEKTAMVRSMFDRIAPRYDFVNRLMTFGLDMGWRRRAIRLLGLAPGSIVADLACGTGDFSRLLATAGYRVAGFDLSLGMMAAGNSPAPAVQADAVALPLPDGALDGLVSGFGLRNFADLARTFAECARVVRPGGRIALLEVDEPRGRLMRLGHRVWLGHVVPRIGAALSDADAYRYLPRSLAYLPPRDDLLMMLAGAGFPGATHHRLAGGVTQVLTATRAVSGTRRSQ